MSGLPGRRRLADPLRVGAARRLDENTSLAAARADHRCD